MRQIDVSNLKPVDREGVGDGAAPVITAGTEDQLAARMAEVAQAETRAQRRAGMA